MSQVTQRQGVSVWKCPACGVRAQQSFDVCPKCGVIVEKAKKINRRNQEESARVSPVEAKNKVRSVRKPRKQR